MFENLTDKLQRAFKNLRGQGTLTEENIGEALKEIRMALLEADVNFNVVKELIEHIREKFERQKVLNGLLRACEKRPVSMSKLEQIVNDAEGFVVDSPDRERKTSEVGELIMNRLKRIDKVAYVRFASVYLDFKDVREFMAELKELLDTKDNTSAKAKTGD